jgi:hypothetical protein
MAAQGSPGPEAEIIVETMKEPVNHPAKNVCPKCGRMFKKSFVPHFHKMKCHG